MQSGMEKTSFIRVKQHYRTALINVNAISFVDIPDMDGSVTIYVPHGAEVRTFLLSKTDWAQIAPFLDGKPA